MSEISFHHSSGPPKKRQRLVTSCSQCRKKKVKCDKNRPVCNVCVKNKLHHLCTYQEPSWDNEKMSPSSNYMSAASIPMAHISVPIKNNSSNNTTSSRPATPQSVTPENSDRSIQSLNTHVTGNNSNGMLNIRSTTAEAFRLREKVDFLESNLRGGDGIVNYTGAKVTHISFYDSAEPIYMRAGRLIACGPLSFGSLVQRDPFLRVSLLKLRKERNNLAPIPRLNVKTSDLVKELIVDDPSAASEGNARVDQAFKTRLMENEGLDELKTTERKETQPFSSVDYEKDTVQKIQDILPDQKLVWLLINKFFNSILVGFIPFLTEEKLRERVKNILNVDPETGNYLVKVTTRFDFAYLGMMLIILRLTSLSVTKKTKNTPDEEYILANPITLQFINIAQMCLNQFRLLRRGALPVLQCSLFMRLYHKYAPEDGDGSDGGDSEVFLGLILQMGNSIGLNRDMKHSEPLKYDYRLHNLWRMVWHEIVTTDLSQSLTMGNPVLINKNCYDTELPKDEVDKANNNLLDPNIWTAVVRNFQMNDQINNLVRDLLDCILNLNQKCVLEELNPKLKRLEDFITHNLGTTNWILDMETNNVQDELNKTYKFKTYLELKTALFVIHYHIYLRANQFSSLIKVFNICMELSPLNLLLSTMNNGKTNYFDDIFGFGAQLILTPIILVSLQKISQVITAFLSRSLDYQYSYPKTQPRTMLIVQIKDELVVKAKEIRDCFISLSSVYYHSWRISKSQKAIFKAITDKDNNLWDRQSKMNKECEHVKDEVNHFKAIPTRNALNEMSINELEAIISAVKYSHYAVSLKNKLKSRKLPAGLTQSPHPATSVYSGSSTHSTPTNSSSTIHMKDKELTNLEIDKLWFQMISNNGTSSGGLNTQIPGGNPESFFSNDDAYAMLDFDKLMGDTSPYDMLGDVPFYHER